MELQRLLEIEQILDNNEADDPDWGAIRELRDYALQQITQSDFNTVIGTLDRVLSVMVNWGRGVKSKYPYRIDEANQQTLKHHAEDMIAAGQKILKDLGHVEGTPQPK